jgi:hypothetical protein
VHGHVGAEVVKRDAARQVFALLSLLLEADILGRVDIAVRVRSFERFAPVALCAPFASGAGGEGV